jgi:hypothetical protein
MTITFAYQGGGEHDITIQWYHDGVALVDGTYGDVVISGATTTTLTILNPDASYDGEYWATVTDNDVAECVIETDHVEVVNCRLEITIQPISQSVEEGGTLELSVAYSGGIGVVTFQWYLDGSPLTDGISGGATVNGATTDTLTITTITTDFDGDYTVVITDPGAPECSAESNAATVDVEEPPAATNTISFAFWMEMLSQPSPACDIISNYDFELWDDPSGSMQSRIRLSCNAVGGGGDEYTFTITVSQGVDSNTVTSAPVSMPLRTWHHIAVVYDGNTGLASVYVNAALLATTSGTPVTFTTQPYGYLELTCASHSAIDYLDSYVFIHDMTGVWVGHALTGAELTTLYNGGAGFNGPPWTGITVPTAWWDFDDAGRIDATENFLDAIAAIELDPSGSIVQFEGLIDFGVIRTGFNRTLETEVISNFAYTA